jgi:hypothetical protein
LEDPTETLGCCRVKLAGILDNPLNIEMLSPYLECVEDLCEIPTVLGHGKTVKQCSFRICDPHTHFTNPYLLDAEIPLGLDLDKLVDRISDGVSVTYSLDRSTACSVKP